MGIEHPTESEGQTVSKEVREAMFEEYFQKMRAGDDAGAIKILLLILGVSGVGGWIALS